MMKPTLLLAGVVFLGGCNGFDYYPQHEQHLTVADTQKQGADTYGGILPDSQPAIPANASPKNPAATHPEMMSPPASNPATSSPAAMPTTEK